MIQQPPPYTTSATGSCAQHTTQTTMNTVSVKHGDPMQAAYVTNPGYPAPTITSTGPTMTTTTTRTIVQQQPPAIFAGFTFHEAPVSMQCPTCKLQIVTATEYEPGSLSWVACFGLSAMGCVFGCCLIPFCLDDMKDVTHSCPNCHMVLGKYRRM